MLLKTFLVVDIDSY